MTDVPHLNIVPLVPRNQEQRTANPNVIKYLESLLEQAKAGEIAGLAVVPRYHDNTACYGLVGSVGGYGMSGALQCLQTHITDLNMGYHSEENDDA